MKTITWLILSVGTAVGSMAQTVPAGWWRASLQRQDGLTIDFNIKIDYKNGRPTWFLRNATELLRITGIQQKQDSVWVQMPVFESEFRLKIVNKRSLQGLWIKGTAASSQVMPVVFSYNEPQRYPQAKAKPVANISGRWAAGFIRNNITSPAIAELKQQGNALTGTLLTPTGDYRYLEGAVHHDTLQLSTFDGSHAYYFSGIIKNDTVITDGRFISGPSHRESWTAVKDANASLPDTFTITKMKAGEERLHFSFPNLDSTMVSINDTRFRHKVVVIQIMGSWCPNCMDETAFLSKYYLLNKHRGIEMIALAYEYSTDFKRSQKSLRKFQHLFNIQYPVLITGVRVSDSLRTEKTLPQMTRIKMFPTTIFIGRDGNVKKIHTGFMGPATGAHYEAYRKNFSATIDELLKENL